MSKKLDRSGKCWNFKHLGKSDVNDYEIVSFCELNTSSDYGKECIGNLIYRGITNE